MVSSSEMDVRFKMTETLREKDKKRKANRQSSQLEDDFIYFCKSTKSEFDQELAAIQEEASQIYDRIEQNIVNTLGDLDVKPYTVRIIALRKYLSTLLNPWDDVLMPPLIHYAKIAFGKKHELGAEPPRHIASQTNKYITLVLQGETRYLALLSARTNNEEEQKEPGKIRAIGRWVSQKFRNIF
jgi:hypothetical protein